MNKHFAEPPHKIIEAALYYAANGHTVFPAPPGEKKSHKSKKYSGGVNWGATSDEAQIRRDFTQFPNANIGWPTGSGDGFFVVEADTLQGHNVDGIASLAALQEKYGPFPATRVARSPSGSMHYYFENPPGVGIKNSASEIAPGVDVRGEGGMVIAPPSVKPGKGMYEWLHWLPIAEAPAWLVDLCKLRPRKKKNSAHAGPELLNQEKILAAIKVIPNDDLGWEDWNKMAMAIWAEFKGSDTGYQAFKQWSQKSGKFDEAGTEEKWHKLHEFPPERIGAGYLFSLADQASPGWRGATAPPEIAKLNETYALVRVGDKVVIMDTSGDGITFLNIGAFETWFAN